MRPTINNLRGQKKNEIENVISDKRKVVKKLPEVPEDLANIEAELGETVLAPGMGFYTVGGKKHSQGGTDLLVPEGSFVFSNSDRSVLTGQILNLFGKKEDDEYTPAELSKNYELNKYLAILKNPDSDHHDKVTAELMIDNNMKKLSEIAFLQEGSKGFPSGTPNLQGIESTMMARGGFVGGVGDTLRDFLDKFDPSKGDDKEPRKAQKARGLKRGFNKFDAPWLDELGYENSIVGLKNAVKSLGYTGNGSVADIQKFLVDRNLDRGNQDVFNNIYSNYGATNQGASKGIEDFPNRQLNRDELMKDLVDGNAGVRTGNLLRGLINTPRDPKAATPPAPMPFQYNINTGNSLADYPLPSDIEYTPSINSGKVPGDKKDGNTQEVKLGLNTLQMMDLGNTLFDMATVRKGVPTRYQNYGLEQASQMAANVRPYDYQSVINEVSKQANSAYRANSMLSPTAAGRGASNAAVFGQAAEQVSKVKQDEYNQNAGLYNSNQQQLAQFASMIGEDKMKNAMLYNDRVEQANVNYDQETKMLKNQALSRLNEYMSHNQAMMYDNMLHPEFTFSPGSGFAGEFSFNPRENIFGASGASSNKGGDSQLEGMVGYIQSTFGIKDREKALSFALQALRSNPTYDDAALGSRSFMNPLLRQFNAGRSGRR